MLLYFNVGTPALLTVFVAYIAAIFALGSYGRNTAFGYGGSILLAIFANPVVAFIVLYVVRKHYHRASYRSH